MLAALPCSRPPAFPRSTMIEAQLILATNLSRHELRLAPNAHVVPEPLITLRPGGALLMTLHRADGQA